MKVITALLICAAAAFAQDAGERVNVPLTDPSRPVRVHAQLMLGGITVRGTNSNQVTVETRAEPGHGSHEHERPIPPNAAGMHRIDGGVLSGLDIVEQDNLVTIKTTSWNRHADLVITVPHHASLQLKAMNDGLIDVEQVDGEIDADSLNGRIILKNVSGSVVAHCLNGEITATVDQVDSTKPMAFSTLNGDIDVTLPESVRANVRMKTDNGEIYSDFDIKLDGGSHVVTNDSGEREHGHRIRLDKTIHGTLNGGGPDYQFTSLNGQIYIRKRK